MNAAELRTGTVLRFEGEFYRVIDASFHAGGGQLGGVVHAKLLNLRTRGAIERRFRPDERLEPVDVDRARWQFIYADGDDYYFMNPENFEQVPIPGAMLGAARAFVHAGMEVAVESFEGRPLYVVLPEAVELRVAETAEPMHQRDTSAMKTARLDNGMEVLVPLFIKTGDLVRVDTATGKYLERAKAKGGSA
ncbi:MAG: elongation factor P [Betaproteobacteria bacterium]